MCQLAIALTPAVLFCGTLGKPPVTTLEDYNPSVTCKEEYSCWLVAHFYHDPLIIFASLL